MAVVLSTFFPEHEPQQRFGSIVITLKKLFGKIVLFTPYIY